MANSHDVLISKIISESFINDVLIIKFFSELYTNTKIADLKFSEITIEKILKEKKIIGFVDVYIEFNFKADKIFKTACMVVEAKTQTEFNDTGQIIRQIKRYKDYFENVNECESYYFVVADSIPELSKRLFEKENIRFIELNE